MSLSGTKSCSKIQVVIVAGWTLSLGVALSVQWIPTEYNTSDDPSRGAETCDEDTHHGIVSPARAKLVVLAGEMAGRWSEETASFLRQLVKAWARSEPPVLQKRAEQAWRLRWGSLLACAAARAFACSLLEKRVSGGVDGDTPSVHEVLGECRFAGLEAA